MYVRAGEDQPVDANNWNCGRKEVGGWRLGEKR